MEKDNYLEKRIKEVEDSYGILNKNQNNNFIMPTRSFKPFISPETQEKLNKIKPNLKNENLNNDIKNNTSKNFNNNFENEQNTDDRWINATTIEFNKLYLTDESAIDPLLPTRQEKDLIIPRQKIENNELKDSYLNKIANQNYNRETAFVPRNNKEDNLFSTIKNEVKHEKQMEYESAEKIILEPTLKKVFDPIVKNYSKFAKKIEKKIYNLKEKDFRNKEKTMNIQMNVSNVDKNYDLKLKKYVNNFVEEDKKKIYAKWNNLKLSSKVVDMINMREKDISNSNKKRNT